MGMENEQCKIIPREKQRGKEAGRKQWMNDQENEDGKRGHSEKALTMQETTDVY